MMTLSPWSFTGIGSDNFMVWHGDNPADHRMIGRVIYSHDALVSALEDAKKRLRDAGMLDGDDGPVCVALNTQR